MSSLGAITISPDKYNLMLAETARSAFLDQGFINTMRFSELNGDEEYDNTFLYAIWHLYLEGGLQQLMEYNEWILRELEMMSSSPSDYYRLLEVQKQRFTDPNIVLNSETPTGLNSDKSVILIQPENGDNAVPTIDDLNHMPTQYITRLLDNGDVKKIIPFDQRARILRYFLDYYKAKELWTNRPLSVEKMQMEEDDKGQRYELPSDSAIAISLIRNYLSPYNQNLVDFVTFYDCHIAILNGRMARARGHKRELLELSKTAMERKPSVELGQEEKEKHWYKPF